MFFIQHSNLMLRPLSDVQTPYSSSSNADRPTRYIYWERRAHRKIQKQHLMGLSNGIIGSHR